MLIKKDLFFDSIFNDNFFNVNKDYVLSENGDEYVFELIIPGITKDNVDIDIVDNVLQIKYENKDNKKIGYVVPSFDRKFTLPNDVDENEIDAEYVNGILKLVLKKNKKNRKSVKIK